jgi:hypothetical protein
MISWAAAEKTAETTKSRVKVAVGSLERRPGSKRFITHLASSGLGNVWV